MLHFAANKPTAMLIVDGIKCPQGALFCYRVEQ
jgi:hypothetical protein